MFRYFLTILLINTYNGSFGGPVGKPNGPISALLESLENRCQNAFLSQQIKSKLEECKVFVPPYNEQQFVCLMFYDINSQLCDAVSTNSKLSLTEDYSSKINVELEVGTACDQAKTWSVNDIKEVPDYKKMVGQVFNSKIGCVKVCGVADVTSQDTNYFCKYFKWGSEILSLNATNETQKVQEKISSPDLTVVEKNKLEIQIPTNQVEPDAVVKINMNLPASNNSQVSELSNISEGNISLLEGTKTQTPLLGQTSQQSKDAIQISPIKDQDKIDVEIPILKTEKPLPQSPSVSPSNNAIDRPSASEIEPPKMKVDDDEALKEEGNNLLKNIKKTSLNEQNNSVDPAEPDYQDSVEGKDNDTEDDNDPDLAGEDDKALLNQEMDPKSQPKKIETPIFTGEIEQFNPNIMADQYSADDDHFFPFFLTGIIIVVVLYVLYHNKSKVSKVVLGLIVEGRQPGRRRNSRGHAYRRLDTLEQAMNTSSAAPPSKIIY